MNSKAMITLKNQQLDVMTLGNVLQKSGYFSDARDAAQAVVKVLAGQELGIGPIASMTGIYIVKGRVTLSANVMAAVIKNSGRYDYRVRQMDNDGCKLEFFENGEALGVSEFTMVDAQNAKLASGDNWQKYPRNMCFARALSNGAKWYCPDIFSGSPVYTPDELGANVDGETGQVIDHQEPITYGPVEDEMSPSVWYPDIQEFKAQVTADFDQPWDEIAAVLKQLGHNGFKPSYASAMYDDLAQHYAANDDDLRQDKLAEWEAEEAEGEAGAFDTN